MTTQGKRCTARASRENTPSSPETSVPRRSSRRAPSTHSAGMRVSATASATTTTDTPARATARTKSICEEQHPRERDRHGDGGEDDGPAGPVQGAPHRVEHLVAGGIGRGSAAEQRTHLLAEPADDEQPVVDAQAEPQHRDDVDRGGVEVEQVREAEQRGQGPRDRGHRPEHREAGREEPAEDEHHEDEADRQRDALAPLAVDLDLLDDPVDEAAQPATFRGRRPGLGDEPVEDGVHLLGGGGLLLGRDVGVQRDDRREAARRRVAVLDEPQGLRARGAAGEDERVDGRVDVLDGGEVGDGPGRGPADRGVGEVHPTEQQGVGAEAAAAGLGRGRRGRPGSRPRRRSRRCRPGRRGWGCRRARARCRSRRRRRRPRGRARRRGVARPAAPSAPGPRGVRRRAGRGRGGPGGSRPGRARSWAQRAMSAAGGGGGPGCRLARSATTGVASWS